MTQLQPSMADPVFQALIEYDFLRDNLEFLGEHYAKVNMIFARYTSNRDRRLALQDYSLTISAIREDKCYPALRLIKEFHILVAILIAIQYYWMKLGNSLLPSTTEEAIATRFEELKDRVGGIQGLTDWASWKVFVVVADLVLPRQKNKWSIFYALHYLIENNSHCPGGGLNAFYQSRMDYIHKPYAKGKNRLPNASSVELSTSNVDINDPPDGDDALVSSVNADSASSFNALLQPAEIQSFEGQDAFAAADLQFRLERRMEDGRPSEDLLRDSSYNMSNGTPDLSCIPSCKDDDQSAKKRRIDERIEKMNARSALQIELEYLDDFEFDSCLFENLTSLDNQFTSSVCMTEYLTYYRSSEGFSV